MDKDQSFFSVEHERESLRFLIAEAELLDDHLYSDWLEMIHPDITYKAPVRTVRENWDRTGVSDSAFYFEETFGTLRTRVEKFKSRFAWSENPSHITRRMVGNVRVKDVEGDDVSVRSNLVVFFHQKDKPNPFILTADRLDTIRFDKSAPQLRSRNVILDKTVLDLGALSIFL